jgi:hypothetical protein
VVVRNLEVVLEIPSPEDLQAQSQVAVEVMGILNLLVVVAEAGHVLLALLLHLLTLLQHCSSQLWERRHHLATLEEIRVIPFPLRYAENCYWFTSTV